MVKKPQAKYSVYEERILRIMQMYYDTKSIYEIASEAGIHWETAAGYVKKLIIKKKIKKVVVDGKRYFKAV